MKYSPFLPEGQWKQRRVDEQRDHIVAELQARGEQYYTPLALWHDGNGNPKRCQPPRQFPDLGGIKIGEVSL